MRLATRLAAPALLAAAALLPIAAAPAAHADLTTPSLIVCQTATLWANYDGVHSRDPIATLTYGTRVGYRYRNNGDDDVLWYQGGIWGFVEASCVAIGAG
jgi:hypothetical protein